MREQNRHERARYSQLRAEYMPPARINVTDAAALETGRRMESTRLEMKSRPMPQAVEFRREPEPAIMAIEERQRKLAELKEFDRAHHKLFE